MIMTIHPEELSEDTDALHKDQDVAIDAGLFDVFDDDDDGGGDDDNHDNDGVGGGFLGDMAIDYDALAFDEGSIGDFLGSAASESITKDTKPPAVPSMKPKKKRQSLKIEHAERGPPPPRWHSEAADKLHRAAIQMEITKLLQMRKTSPPSEAWLQQLPHKVRKLEERLYRSAPSLEAYLDRKSLKTRLKTVAKAITQQHQERKMRRMSLESNRSSVSSLSSFGNNSNRDSITSVGSLDSLQRLQRMLAATTLPPMTANSASNVEISSKQSASQPAHMMNFTTQVAGSQAGVEGVVHQEITENKIHHAPEHANFPSQIQLPRAPLPLPLPIIHSSQNAMGISQNSQGNFVNAPNNLLQTPIAPNNSTGMLNQAGVLNSSAVFGQPMNMMMMQSANAAPMNSALGTLHLQQRQMQQNQMQYTLNHQQSQILQQQSGNAGMMGVNTSFGLPTQQSSLPSYFMSNLASNTSMPPPPRLFEGTRMASSAPPQVGAPNSSGATSNEKSGKKSKQ